MLDRLGGAFSIRAASRFNFSENLLIAEFFERVLDACATLALSVLQPYSSRFREGRNEVLLVPAGGGEARRVDPLPHGSIGTRTADGPVWSPDGGALAFASEGAVWIARLGSTQGGQGLADRAGG